MGFRVGRKHASHVYPQSPAAGGGNSGPPGPPGPPTPGGVSIIRYRVGPGPGTFNSVTVIPAGSIILMTSFDNDVADDPANALFGAGTTATIGTAAAPTQFQDATKNTPDSAGNYQSFLNTPLAVAGAVQTVIAGAGGGSASVTVEYCSTPQP